MCYFMFVKTHNKFNHKIIEQYQKKFEIYISDITKWVEEPERPYIYYNIHRQCACDFISSNQNQSEIIEIFQILSKSGAFQYVHFWDDGQFDDLNITLQMVMNRCPIHKIHINHFISNFPYNLATNTIYEVLQENCDQKK